MRDPAALSKKDLIRALKTIQSEFYWPTGRFGIPLDLHRLLTTLDLHKVPIAELPIPDLVYVETRHSPIPAILERYTNGYAIVSKWFGFKKGWSRPIRIPRDKVLGPIDPADTEIQDMLHQTWFPSMRRRILKKLEKERSGLGDGEVFRHPSVLYEEIVETLARSLPEFSRASELTEFDAALDLAFTTIKVSPQTAIGLVERYTKHPFEEGSSDVVEEYSGATKVAAKAIFSLARDVMAKHEELTRGR
jgi:hypothetical protein